MLDVSQEFQSRITISKFLLKNGLSSKLIMKSANLVNNIHSLCVAARQLPTVDEKIAILKHFREIEDSTGWKTHRYVLELERLWGLQ